MTAYENQLLRQGILPGTPGYLLARGLGKPKAASPDLGTPPEPKPGELYVQVYEPDRDEFDRVKFFLFWWGEPRTDIRCPGLTLRGQVFHADERVNIREALQRGDRVFAWPSGEEVAEQP
jgi:hypothetical protein